MGTSEARGGRLPWMQIGIVILSLVSGLVAGRIVTGGGSGSTYESTAKILVGPISAERSTLAGLQPTPAAPSLYAPTNVSVRHR